MKWLFLDDNDNMQMKANLLPYTHTSLILACKFVLMDKCICTQMFRGISGYTAQYGSTYKYRIQCINFSLVCPDAGSSSGTLQL